MFSSLIQNLVWSEKDVDREKGGQEEPKISKLIKKKKN